MGKSWKTYAGCEYNDLMEAIQDAADRIGLPYSILSIRNGTASFLGSSENAYLIQIQGKKMQLNIRVYSAKCDPVARPLFSLLGNKDALSKLSYIRIDPITPETEDTVRKMITGIALAIPQPWDVSHHPQMRLAWLMRRQIKNRWFEWMKEVPSGTS